MNEALSSAQRPLPSALAAAGGPLAGRTILRFAHAFDTGGGTERYLDDLDGALLERNSLTIIRVQITCATVGCDPEEVSIGRGKLIRVRLPLLAEGEGNSPADEQSLRFRIKQKLRDLVLYNPLVWNTAGRKWALGRPLPPRPGEAVGAGRVVAEAMRTRIVDLVMLHFFGGSDADEIITRARANNVPFAVLNHYSNDRFMHLAMRKHAMLADGVAGVNGLQVPAYLRHRFTNLSDGIDTDFFNRALARPVPDLPAGPIILLPARVVREKGPLDLVRAAGALREAGIKCTLIFAGRLDPSDFLDQLRNEISRLGMTESARFLGAIPVEALRDWYAAGMVMAFPTYHHEGLPRVVIEAQAMGIPVIAYATGGVPGAIVHENTGLLVPTGDVARLTQGLRRLLASGETRAAMGARGRQAVEKSFTLPALAARHEAFYLRSIAGASRL